MIADTNKMSHIRRMEGWKSQGWGKERRVSTGARPLPGEKIQSKCLEKKNVKLVFDKPVPGETNPKSFLKTRFGQNSIFQRGRGRRPSHLHCDC